MDNGQVPQLEQARRYVAHWNQMLRENERYRLYPTQIRFHREMLGQIIRVAFLTVTVPLTHSIQMVYWVYPLTWSLSSLAFLIYYKKANWMHGVSLVKEQA